MWIAAFSYLMVWWATVTGDAFSIPPEVCNKFLSNSHGSRRAYPKPQWARKFKKVQDKKTREIKLIKKKFFREIAFLAVLNFFLVQKLIFGHF